MANPDVLIVDDNQLDLELFRKGLAQAGLRNRLFEATSGKQAIRLLSGSIEPAPDDRCVILLDINMPKMDGLTLLEHLRELPRWQRAVCFMLTSSSYEDDVLRAKRASVEGYILKHRLNEALSGTNGTLRAHLEAAA